MTVREFTAWAESVSIDAGIDVGDLHIEFRVTGRDPFYIIGAALAADGDKTRVLLY